MERADEVLARARVDAGLAADRRVYLREQSRLAHPLRAHHEAASPIHGPADDPVAGLSLDRQRLSRQHRLIDGAPALDDDAVHRNLLAGPDAQHVARLYACEGNVSLLPVGFHPARRFGCEA